LLVLVCPLWGKILCYILINSLISYLISIVYNCGMSFKTCASYLNVCTIYTHMCTHTRTQHACTHTHTYTHTRARTHTRTHTQTHTQHTDTNIAECCIIAVNILKLLVDTHMHINTQWVATCSQYVHNLFTCVLISCKNVLLYQHNL